MQGKMPLMSDLLTKPRPRQRSQLERPRLYKVRLYKVILLNDDFTPREFVVTVLKAVFGMNEDQAYRVMIAAHKRDSCVVAVYTRDVAESKATEGTEAGRCAGFPLLFAAEPEE
jgi:ATP-dependent Clp protease adaptor protein ClpS